MDMAKKSTLLTVFVLAIMVCGLVFVLGLANAKAAPKIITVPDNYSTIQAAIDNAIEDDVVYVKNGVYHEHLIIEKSISLIGQDSQNTIIIGDQNPYRQTIVVHASNVTISGFMIRDNPNNIGIYVDEIGLKQPFSCQIIGNSIVNNSIGISLGTLFEFGTGAWLPSNHIISCNNINQNSQYGISCGASNTTISENNITGNNWQGIKLSTCANVTVYANKIKANGQGENNPPIGNGGLNLMWAGPFYVYENNITGNYGYGVQFGPGCNNSTVYRNNIENNIFGINLLNFPVGGDSTIGSGNIVYANNLIANSNQALIEKEYTAPVDVIEQINGTDIVFWDNGTVGNYWSNYQIMYPNASEVDDTGIGNTPYMIDKNNIDHYPLVRPINISTVTPNPNPSLSPSITPFDSLTPTTTAPEFSAWVILTLTMIVSLTVAILVERKQYKQS